MFSLFSDDQLFKALTPRTLQGSLFPHSRFLFGNLASRASHAHNRSPSAPRPLSPPRHSPKTWATRLAQPQSAPGASSPLLLSPDPQSLGPLTRDAALARHKNRAPEGVSRPARSFPAFPPSPALRKECANSNTPFAASLLWASRAAPKVGESRPSSIPLPLTAPAPGIPQPPAPRAGNHPHRSRSRRKRLPQSPLLWPTGPTR